LNNFEIYIYENIEKEEMLKYIQNTKQIINTES